MLTRHILLCIKGDEPFNSPTLQQEERIRDFRTINTTLEVAMSEHGSLQRAESKRGEK